VGLEMGEDPGGSSKPFDPLEPFRGMRDAYLEAMAKTMVEVVNTEAYAQATGAALDSSLTLSAPFREGLEKAMLPVLQQFSMPFRQDIVALAERFTNFEMRLDDIDAKLDRLAIHSGPAKPVAQAEPVEVAAPRPKTKSATHAQAPATRKRSAVKPASARRRDLKKGSR
jgi:hypothetical protein